MKQAYPTFIAEYKGDFLVYVPDMEIYTEGKNMADAIEMARDVKTEILRNLLPDSPKSVIIVNSANNRSYIRRSLRNAVQKRYGRVSLAMYYGAIKTTDIANGTGVRVTLFVSGCTHHCKGCFQPESWDFNYGSPYTEETGQQILDALGHEYIRGLTLLGGEPFEPDNQRELVKLLRDVREQFPQKDIWCYTGYTYETDLLGDSRAKCEVTDEMLSMIDVLVDGEFHEEEKNISLRFRGSENQRLIDLPKTRHQKKIILLEI